MVDELQAKRTDAKASNRDVTIAELFNLVLADMKAGKTAPTSCIIIMGEREYDATGSRTKHLQHTYRCGLTREQEGYDLTVAMQRFWRNQFEDQVE